MAVVQPVAAGAGDAEAKKLLSDCPYGEESWVERVVKQAGARHNFDPAIAETPNRSYVTGTLRDSHATE